MKRLLLVLLVAVLVVLPAAAQSFTLPAHIKGLTPLSYSWQTLTATDTALADVYIPRTMYLRSVVVIANTVEDTASFVVKYGTGFASTAATVAVNAAGVSYSNPSGSGHKFFAGQRLRLQSTLQDTLYRVTGTLWFTIEP